MLPSLTVKVTMGYPAAVKTLILGFPDVCLPARTILFSSRIKAIKVLDKYISQVTQTVLMTHQWVLHNVLQLRDSPRGRRHPKP